MDFHERRVIRRKKPLIAETLGFSRDDQKKYIMQGLLTDNMIGDILGETTEYGQMFRFIDHLMQKENSYDKILCWLDDADKTWIADEIRAEVTCERGQLNVEEYVYREAGVLVHRQFGKSIIIPEAEKKELQLLLALRYQTAKEAWQQRLIDSQLSAERLKTWKSELGGRLKQILQKIESFLRIHQKHINGVAHNTYSAHEQTRPDPDPNNHRDYLQVLDNRVECMLDALARVTLEKQNMTDERKRCLQVLQMDNKSCQLDQLLNHALNNAADDAVKAQRDAYISDKMAETLDARMRALRLETDKELAFKERQNAQLSSSHKGKEREVEQLQQNLDEAMNSLTEAKQEIARLNRKCAMMEKTRRLGYYTPGWYDKLYGVENVEYTRCTDESPPPLVKIIPRVKSARSYSDMKRNNKLTRRQVPPLFSRKSYSVITAKTDTAKSSPRNVRTQRIHVAAQPPKSAR